MNKLEIGTLMYVSSLQCDEKELQFDEKELLGDFRSPIGSYRRMGSAHEVSELIADWMFKEDCGASK